MESKKRPHADDGEHSRSKKRAVSNENDSPSHLNGASTSHADEPKDDDPIELFRKEAIFRRMKHYSREADRKQARVQELEKQIHTCRVGVAAIEACWTQLLGTIRTLVKPEDLPSLEKESEGESFSGIYNLALHLSSDGDDDKDTVTDPEYIEAVRDKMHTTTDIVKAFVDLASQRQSGPSNEDLLRRCQAADTKCSALRSELSLVQSQLRDSEAQRDEVHEKLISAEMRADRLQCRPASQKLAVVGEDRGEGTPAEGGSPAQPQAVNGNHGTDLDTWEHIATLRETKIQELSRERQALQDQLQDAQIQVSQESPENLVSESMYYKVLLERASKFEHDATEAQTQVIELKKQYDGLCARHTDFERGLKFAQDACIAEMKTSLAKRDLEVTRLREQRDQYQAEITERKAREQARLTSAQEFKALAETRAERIIVLQSEIKRLKTRLAANADDADLVSFLWQSTADGPSYVEDLKRRLTATEEEKAALEKTLAERSDSLKGEADLRRQLAQVQKQLEKYQVVYGDASSMPPETAQLSAQLQHKQSEVERLQLQEKNREQTESALYDELDKLSSAWEALDRQVKSKVLDLAAMEERLNKLNTERAKSENKFYQCMRDKEATETERKKLSVNLEKAAKAIEKLTDSEKNLMYRAMDLEKELSLVKKVVDTLRDKTATLEMESAEWKIRAQGERKQVEEIRAAFQEHSQSAERKRAELRKFEESLLKSKKEADKQTAKLKSMSTTSGTDAREAELQEEVTKCMLLLKCSTCQMNMRNTVITKCLHTFCRDCVDARVATRQRKCPACNVAFSQGEVHTLFFQ
ncbi:BRE1-domain-containing protein [Epithele typhae]|uniref:BRE1-domain-containing protein n=1 Tax=Epithele typhae TaxID=378194 RepID=UPI002008002C|nr:BRE1-domain-containing protein [Epithele typhae]KAH9929494.1 BRE1-domain-containing protein [Epithele typhae]